jgi:bacillithiol system protein YtxJ
MMNWKFLESEQDWKDALALSGKKPVAIFKHSTRCSVSFMAKKNLEQSWEYSEEEVEPLFLDLIRYRALSDQVANDTGVRHESPQLILLKDGEAIMDSSHYSIDADAIASYLK